MALTDKAREFLEKRRAAFEENKALETDVVAHTDADERDEENLRILRDW